MTGNRRFTLTNPKNSFQEMKCGIDDRSNTLTFNEVVALLNSLNEENEQLKRENRELNELCGKYVIKIGRLEKENKDLKSAVDFYKDFQMDARELSKENEELKNTIESFREKDKNCHNCKNCNTYGEGEYGFDFLCEKDCMNNDGYFDYEYHEFKKPCICPFWELEE